MFVSSVSNTQVKNIIRKTILISLSLLVVLAGGCTSADDTSDQGLPPPVSVGPLPPALVEALPMPGSELSLTGSISFYFNQAMDRASVEAALSGEPGLSGSFNWIDDATVSFTPSNPWLPDTPLTITIDKSAQAANELVMQEAVSLEYRTVGYLTLTQKLPEDATFDVDPTSAIVAAFNRPIVPLGADPDFLIPAFSLLPAAPGRGEWLNTSTYIFYPDPGLEGGLVYSVTLDSHLTSTDGAPLEEATTWGFHTALPAVMSSEPGASSTNNPLDDEVEITFNQPMDPQSVESHFSLLGPSGKVPGAFTWDDANTQVTFTPNNLLQRGASYTYMLEPQTAARGGSWLENRLTVSFNTVSEFAVLETDPWRGGTKEYYAPVTLTFNAPFDVENPLDYITIEPEVSFNYDWYGNSIWLHGAYEAGTSYSIRISSSLGDIWGDTLGEDYIFNFLAASPAPQLMVSTHLGGGVLFIDPDEPVLSAQAVNVSNVNVSVDDISLPDFFELNSSDGYQQAPRLIR
jgi:hypothetical protein